MPATKLTLYDQHGYSVADKGGTVLDLLANAGGLTGFDPDTLIVCAHDGVSQRCLPLGRMLQAQEDATGQERAIASLRERAQSYEALATWLQERMPPPEPEPAPEPVEAVMPLLDAAPAPAPAVVKAASRSRTAAR